MTDNRKRIFTRHASGIRICENHKDYYPGARFGQWTILGFPFYCGDGKGKCCVVAACSCGSPASVVAAASLKSGASRACIKCCPCYLIKHGQSGTSLYSAWVNMKTRCNKQYPGQRNGCYIQNGISVCDEWFSSFETFYEWAMSNGYKEGLTIERIDSTKNYCPDNCTFSTAKEQARNRSTNRNIEFRGEAKTLSEWSERLGIKRSTLEGRLLRGMGVEEAFTKPVAKARKFQCRGESLTIDEWAEKLGINSGTLRCRLSKKDSVEEALFTPVDKEAFTERLLEHGGKVQNLISWSRETGISESAIRQRLNSGWPVKKALETPVRKKRGNH